MSNLFIFRESQDTCRSCHKMSRHCLFPIIFMARNLKENKEKDSSNQL